MRGVGITGDRPMPPGDARQEPERFSNVPFEKAPSRAARPTGIETQLAEAPGPSMRLGETGDRVPLHHLEDQGPLGPLDDPL